MASHLSLVWINELEKRKNQYDVRANKLIALSVSETDWLSYGKDRETIKAFCLDI